MNQFDEDRTEDHGHTAAAPGLAPEHAPSLADLAAPEEGAGAWPDGWFRAEVVSGYTTGRGKVFETIDQPSRDGSSRNLFLCLRVHGDVFVPSTPNVSKRVKTTGPGGERMIRATINYKPTDFTSERIAKILEAREHFKNVQGAWPNKDLQASSLSLGRLGQIEKAYGISIISKFDQERGCFPGSIFTGKSLDIRLKLKEESGFSEVAAMAAPGSHVK